MDKNKNTVFGECAKHKGHNMVNCVLCEMEKPLTIMTDKPHDPNYNDGNNPHKLNPEPCIEWWLSLTQKKRYELHPKMLIDIEDLRRLFENKKE